MKNIVVAFDFSDASYNALSYAAFLANSYQTKLIVVHAFESKKLTVKDASKKEDEQLMKKELDGIVRKFTVKIKGLVQEGNTIKTLNEVAAKNNSSLIVMGMKGKGESHSKFGSTTTAMISKTTVPLLVVPKNALYESIETITLASDFHKEKLLKDFSILEEMIEKFNPFIHILNVQKTGSKVSAEKIAEKMRLGLEWDKYNHSFNVMEQDEIEEAISKFLKKHATDLLVMVARKKNFVSSIFTPSHTRKMTYQTKIPLLILHE